MNSKLRDTRQSSDDTESGYEVMSRDSASRLHKVRRKSVSPHTSTSPQGAYVSVWDITSRHEAGVSLGASHETRCFKRKSRLNPVWSAEKWAAVYRNSVDLTR